MSKEPTKRKQFSWEISPIQGDSPFAKTIKDSLRETLNPSNGKLIINSIEYDGEITGPSVKIEFDKGSELIGFVPLADPIKVLWRFSSNQPEKNRANGLKYWNGTVLDQSNYRVGKIEISGKKPLKQGRPSNTDRDVGICMALAYLVSICEDSERKAKEEVSKIFSIPPDKENGFRTLNSAIGRGKEIIGEYQVFFTAEDEESTKHIGLIKQISKAILYEDGLVITADLWHYVYGDKKAEYLINETFMAHDELRDFLLRKSTQSKQKSQGK